MCIFLKKSRVHKKTSLTCRVLLRVLLQLQHRLLQSLQAFLVLRVGARRDGTEQRGHEQKQRQQLRRERLREAGEEREHEQQDEHVREQPN